VLFNRLAAKANPESINIERGTKGAGSRGVPHCIRGLPAFLLYTSSVCLAWACGSTIRR
jgi:hypothetical protein